MTTERAYFGYENRIVERLRHEGIPLVSDWDEMRYEAADEIERLREWDRKRQEDIISLGQEVGRLTTLNAELVALIKQAQKGTLEYDWDGWENRVTAALAKVKERK